MLTFEQFQTNVQQWSTARGIYEHSSALVQALKAVSEVGELADATIKNDIAGLKDAIGDVAVCLVNVAELLGVRAWTPLYSWTGVDDTVQESAVIVASYVSDVACDIALGDCKWSIEDKIMDAIEHLRVCAIANNLDFLDCCSAAWREIKDRTGHMVAGGAFVKDE